MKKLIACMLACLMLLSCFTACGGPKTPPAGGTTGATGTTGGDETTGGDTGTTGGNETTGGNTDTTPKPVTEIKLSELSGYNVIRSQKASVSVQATAKLLCDKLNELDLGKTFQHKMDLIREGFADYTEIDCEFLIGETNREETLQFKRSIRYGDYGYQLINKKIVIYAYTEENLQKAVNLFITNMLSEEGLEDRVVISVDETRILRQSYTFNKVQLEGTPLIDCVLIYPQRGKEEQEIAEQLADYLLKETGYWVPTQADSATPIEGAHEILIGNTNRAMQVPTDLNANETYLATVGKTTLVSGADERGLYQAVNLFRKRFAFADTSSKTLNVTIEAPEIEDALESKLSTMSFNLWVGGDRNARAPRVIAQIRSYMPDTFGVQEADPAWMAVLKEGLPEYACVGVGREASLGGEHSAVFYRKDKFNLLESNTKWLSDTPDVAGSKYDNSSYIRIVTWAVLQRKSDGLIFTHANTHLDWVDVSDDQLRVLFRQVPTAYPIILTGDMNLSPDTANYRQILNAGYINASREADRITFEPRDDWGVGREYPLTTGGSEIDYIFFSRASVLLYRVCSEDVDGATNGKIELDGDNYTFGLSDHYAIYAEYVFC